MKVLIVCPYFHPHIGGVESHVKDLSKFLVKRGFEVTVLSNDIPKGYREFVLEGVHVIRTKPLAEVFRTPIDPQIYFATKKIGREFDLIHIHFPPPLTPYFASSAAKKIGKPVILTYHCDPTLDNIFLTFLERAYEYTLGRRIIANSDAVIVTTEQYKRTSKLLWGVKSYWVIPNAVDIEFFDGKDYSKEFYEKYNIEEDFALFVGRLVPHKNVEVFIEAAEYTNVRHIIIGDGPHKRFLETYAKHLGVEDRVLFLGKIPKEDLRAAYSAASLVVLPSISRLEAFGIVLLEALAMGRPILAADIPGVSTIVDIIGSPKFNPMDPSDLGEKITKIIENKSYYKNISLKGQKIVREKYNWARIISEIIRVYEETFERVKI